MSLMNVTRSSASTLHLQMGQEVMYLLLVTSLIANFILAALALRSSKEASVLNAARPYADLIREHRELRSQQSQLQARIRELQATINQLKADRDNVVVRNETLQADLNKAESERTAAGARERHAEEKIKQLESLKGFPQDQPPIIPLREADGFVFSPGSAEVSPAFLAKLAGRLFQKL